MNFLDRFSKSIEISNSTKNRIVRDDLFHSNRRTDRQTDMTELEVAFHNFANAPKTSQHLEGDIPLCGKIIYLL